MDDSAFPSFDVEVIRSPRRRSSISARLEANTLVIRIPATFSAAQEAQAVKEMMAKVARKHSTSKVSDEDLVKRAHQLNRLYLENRATVGSIRWVGNQNALWGLCTPATADIRISDRLKHVPDYVLDAVLIHELVHTFIPDHSKDFYAWADKAPQAHMNCSPLVGLRNQFPTSGEYVFESTKFSKSAAAGAAR